MQNGGRPVQQPSVLQGTDGQESVVSEVEMYGDVVMRFISGSFQVPFAYSCYNLALQSSHFDGLHARYVSVQQVS